MLRHRCKGLYLRFLTLTIAHSRHPLKDQLARLRKHFDTLRHSRAWKDHVSGGCVTLEVKLTDAGQWHPHLHIIFAGSFWDTGEISDLWRKITGDSFITKIKAVGTETDKYVGYVCSYISKPNKAGDVFHAPERLLEMMTAMKGKRLCDLLGNWREWVKEDEDAYDDPGDWRTVASIDKVWACAAAGEIWALSVLKNIGRRFLRSPGVEESTLFDSA